MKKKNGEEEEKFGMNQETINNLILLQRRGIEYGGHIEKNKIAGVRVGRPTSVETDVSIGTPDYDFHVHPSSIPSPPSLGNKKKEEKEFVCSVAKSAIRTSMISPEDTFIALQVRSMKGVSSLMVSEYIMTKYFLNDPVKYEAFKEIVKIKYGNKNETSIMRALDDAFVLILNEEMEDAYGKRQQFSACDDITIEKNLKTRWYAFLMESGLSIEEKEISYK